MNRDEQIRFIKEAPVRHAALVRRVKRHLNAKAIEAREKLSTGPHPRVKLLRDQSK